MIVALSTASANASESPQGLPSTGKPWPRLTRSSSTSLESMNVRGLYNLDTKTNKYYGRKGNNKRL